MQGMNEGRQFNSKCYGCGGLGHYKRECPRLTTNGSAMGGPGSRSGIGGQVKIILANQDREVGLLSVLVVVREVTFQLDVLLSQCCCVSPSV